MNKYICLLFIICFFSSCSNFLEEKSQDQIIPTKISDVTELIYGELIGRNVGIQQVWDVMSDDVTTLWRDVPGGSDIYRKGMYSYYTWKDDIEYDQDNNFKTENFYARLYEMIVLCNALEELIPEMEGGESEKLNALGEVYFFRAWAYLDLANIYAMPYVDEESSKITPCVPINRQKGLGMLLYERSSQREVYDLIETDIKNAISCFEKSGITPTIYRPGLKAACILATRIYLMEKKYESVIEYANKIEGLTNLYSMQDYVEQYGVIEKLDDKDYDPSTYVHFIDKRNTEIVFTYEDLYRMETFSPLGSGVCGMYFPASELLESYTDEGDLRRKVFFDEDGYITKCAFNVRSVKQTNLKITEALLNRAEAYACLENELAKEDLMALRRNRFSTETVPEITGDLIEAVRMERRRELCFEGLRWLDLRRWGMPEITHDYYLEDNARKAVYTLKQGDAGYAFNLPKAVLDLNQTIVQHKRPQRDPVIVNL